MNAELLTGFIKALGFKPANPDGLDILCLQGLSEMGGSLKLNSNEVDRYNELIIPILPDKYHVFIGTIDPGLYYRQNVLNEQGCAHVAFGQHEFVKGKHQGEHDALRAKEETILIMRDYDRNYKFGYGDKIGWEYNTGINIHAMGTGNKVGKWSAGCIGIHGGWIGDSWKTFIDDYVEPTTGSIRATVWRGRDFISYADNPDKEFYPTLHFGCVSAHVAYIQCKLHLTEDGIFGNGTHDAVKYYQLCNQLDVDGIVGKNTWGRLEVSNE